MADMCARTTVCHHTCTHTRAHTQTHNTHKHTHTHTSYTKTSTPLQGVLN